MTEIRMPLIIVTPSPENQLSITPPLPEQFMPTFKFTSDDDDTARRETKTFVVGSGMTGLYIDETFGFDATKRPMKRLTINERISTIFGAAIEIDNEEDKLNMYQRIPKVLAWCILIYATINNAMMPPWIMTIPAEKYLRIAWRFLLQGLFLIPFVMYEYRNGSGQVQIAYSWSYLKINMRKLYLASVSTSLTQGVYLFCFEYTNVSTVFLLGTQTNFWLSVLRKDASQLENAGRIICIAGYVKSQHADSYLLSEDDQPDIQLFNPYLYFRPPWERICIGDMLPFLASFMQAQLTPLNAELRQCFPPFLQTFIVSYFVVFNVTLFSYFIDGTTLDIDSKWGWFALMDQGRFPGFLYMALLLTLGLFISSFLVSKLFEAIVPATASLFEPLITSVLLRVNAVQYYPNWLTYCGYLLMIPGQFIIIYGQYIIKKHEDRLSRMSNKQYLDPRGKQK